MQTEEVYHCLEYRCVFPLLLLVAFLTLDRYIKFGAFNVSFWLHLISSGLVGRLRGCFSCCRKSVLDVLLVHVLNTRSVHCQCNCQSATTSDVVRTTCLVSNQSSTALSAAYVSTDYYLTSCIGHIPLLNEIHVHHGMVSFSMQGQ